MVNYWGIKKGLVSYNDELLNSPVKNQRGQTQSYKDMLKGKDEEFDGMSDETNDIEEGLFKQEEIDFSGFEIIEDMDGPR